MVEEADGYNLFFPFKDNSSDAGNEIIVRINPA